MRASPLLGAKGSSRNQRLVVAALPSQKIFFSAEFIFFFIFFFLIFFLFLSDFFFKQLIVFFKPAAPGGQYVLKMDGVAGRYFSKAKIVLKGMMKLVFVFF